MDFAALPPEINSGRMYSGPGVGSMLAGAAAWDGLAGELESAAASFSGVVSGLTAGPWLGPASASMAAAAAPYVAWLSGTAAQAAQAGIQAKAAAGAYEAAFAMTVPPPVIAANRALLMALIATNFLGQNTPVIAATEAHYGEMWAQDAAAMYAYAGSSAAASTLTPFTRPSQTTNPTGPAAQAAAVAQAAGTSAGTGAQTIMSSGSQLLSAMPQALQSLAQPLQSSSSALSSGLSGILQTLGFSSPQSYVSLLGLISTSSFGAINSGFGAHQAAALGTTALAVPAVTPGLGSEVGAVGSAGLAGEGGGAVSAGVGRAASIGALAVPPSWSVPPPAISPAAAGLPGTSLSAGPAVSTGGPGSFYRDMLLATLAGRGLGSGVTRSESHPTVMPRPLAGE